MNDREIVIRILHSFQCDYTKKMKICRCVTDQHELHKKSTFIIEISLLMLEKIKKIYQTLKRCLNVMWLTVDAVAHSSFSHHNANFSQTKLSSLDELKILKMVVDLSSSSDESSEKKNEEEKMVENEN